MPNKQTALKREIGRHHQRVMDSPSIISIPSRRRGRWGLLVCMDSRQDLRGLGDLRFLAGSSSALLASCTREEVTEIVREVNPQAISTHPRCGAHRYATACLGVERSPDEFGDTWIKELSGVLRIPYQRIPLRAGRHETCVIYFDTTGNFNPYARNLPRGFVVNSACQGLQHALTELKLAIGIAFGENGMGVAHFRETPLLIVVISRKDSSTVFAGVHNAISEVSPYYRDMIFQPIWWRAI